MAWKCLLAWDVLNWPVLALVLAIGLNVFVGAKAAEKLPVKTIKVITSGLFILFGIISLSA